MSYARAGSSPAFGTKLTDIILNTVTKALVHEAFSPYQLSELPMLSVTCEGGDGDGSLH